MKLRTKLIISFCCIILLPILFFMVFGAALAQYQVLSVRHQYGIDVSISDFVPGSARLFDRMIRQIQKEMGNKLKEDPDFWGDEEAMKEYFEEISSADVNIVVFKGKELFFETEELHTVLADEFQEQLEQGSEDLDARYIGDKRVYIYNLLRCRFPDGSPGSVYAVIYSDQWLPQLKTFLIQAIFSIVFILMMTAAIFTVWIYRSILRPIRVLKDATEKIRDGNLCFHLTVNDRDELGELCSAFEEMRQRLKETTEQKMQFDDESKELISNISHDLKTPITAIKGYVEGIMDGVADTPDKLDRYVKTIYNKAIDMDRLIDELTFYSKIDTNRIPYNFNRICVSEYFSDCAEEVGMELESENIRFQYTNYVEESVRIIADPEQLRRVINNIISNSVKYFDKEQCFINMRIRDVGDFIQVEIEDNGRGIAKKDIPYIFDRFYRTDSSRNSQKGGSGIGLSIVRKIIEDHGGKIWATSKENAGTTMCFVIRKYQEG